MEHRYETDGKQYPKSVIFINGKSQGHRKVGIRHRYQARFNVICEPGRLMAISYDKGREIGRQTIVTAGMPQGCE